MSAPDLKETYKEIGTADSTGSTMLNALRAELQKYDFCTEIEGIQ